MARNWFNMLLYTINDDTIHRKCVLLHVHTTHRTHYIYSKYILISFGSHSVCSAIDMNCGGRFTLCSTECNFILLLVIHASTKDRNPKHTQQIDHVKWNKTALPSSPFEWPLSSLDSTYEWTNNWNFNFNRCRTWNKHRFVLSIYSASQCQSPCVELSWVLSQ